MTRHRIRLALSFATPLVVLSLAACGGQTAPDPTNVASDPEVSSEASLGTPAPSDEPSSEPTSAEPASASQAEVRALGRALVDAGTGSFRSVTGLTAGQIERTGQYDLDRLAHTVQVDYQIGAESFSIDSVVLGEDFYFRFTPAGEEPTRCWSYADFGAIDTQLGQAGIVKPAEGSRGAPPELMTLLFLSVRAGGTVTSDLYTTASVLGNKFTTFLSIDPDADNTTPIELTQGTDGSASWSTDFSTLLESVGKSGAEPDPAIDALFGTQSSIEAELTDVGGPVTVQAPPDRLVVRPTGDDAADQRAFEQCNRA